MRTCGNTIEKTEEKIILAKRGDERARCLVVVCKSVKIERDEIEELGRPCQLSTQSNGR